ncbi:MAG: Uma2 family endonuclease [Chloroflexi bacterium]|nr:Uma2 family endonuclease [Chloroflexota bacterium]
MDEYHQLIEMGFFQDDERIELIEGILVPMPPMSSRQAACIRKLQNRFTSEIFPPPSNSE